MTSIKFLITIFTLETHIKITKINKIIKFPCQLLHGEHYREYTYRYCGVKDLWMGKLSLHCNSCCEQLHIPCICWCCFFSFILACSNRVFSNQSLKFIISWMEISNKAIGEDGEKKISQLGNYLLMGENPGTVLC
mgnify:CR=1 FL=1